VEAGYGRLLFRDLGGRWQAGFKHLSIDSKQAAGVGHITTQAPLRETAGIVKNFYGIVCAPAVKVNIPRRFDVWLMPFASVGAPSISLSKPVLAAEKVSVKPPCRQKGLPPLQPQRIYFWLQEGGPRTRHADRHGQIHIPRAWEGYH